jgi:hypothetical protein
VTTVSRSVVSGEWYAVLGETVVVLVPPAARERVAAIWERVDAGAGFDEVLDALISRGLRELPGFVLVSRDGDDVKVVIRGAGLAELTTAEGEVAVEGSTDTTWVERSLTGVTGMRLRVADAAGTPYAVGPGLVRVAEVQEPAAAPPPAVEPPSPPAQTHAASVPPPPVPVAPEVDLSEAETGVLSPPGFTPPPPSIPLTPPEPPAPSEPSAPPAEPERPPTPQHSAGTPRSVARLVFSSGQVIDVDGVIIVGRAPRAKRPGDENAQLVTVPSPNQEISSTHVEFRPGTGSEHGSAVVTDLGSTNGTVIVQPGLRPEDLHPGVAVQLNPGAIVDLGEGLTVQVAQAD